MFTSSSIGDVSAPMIYPAMVSVALEVTGVGIGFYFGVAAGVDYFVAHLEAHVGD